MYPRLFPLATFFCWAEFGPRLLQRSAVWRTRRPVRLGNRQPSSQRLCAATHFFALLRPHPDGGTRRRDGDPCAGGDIKRGGFRRLPWEHRVGPRSALLPRVRPPGRVPAGPSIDLDADVPADARLEEFNLLIPVGADRSGIPVSILRFMLTNTMGVPISSSM